MEFRPGADDELAMVDLDHARDPKARRVSEFDIVGGQERVVQPWGKGGFDGTFLAASAYCSQVDGPVPIGVFAYASQDAHNDALIEIDAGR